MQKYLKDNYIKNQKILIEVSFKDKFVKSSLQIDGYLYLWINTTYSSLQLKLSRVKLSVIHTHQKYR